MKKIFLLGLIGLLAASCTAQAPTTSNNPQAQQQTQTSSSTQTKPAVVLNDKLTNCGVVDTVDQPRKELQLNAWYEKLIAKAGKEWTLHAVCFNPNVNIAAFMLQKSDSEDNGTAQFGVYDIASDTFNMADPVQIGLALGSCGDDLTWTDSNTIAYSCGGGDAGSGYTDNYQYSVSAKTSKLVKSCTTDPVNGEVCK